MRIDGNIVFYDDTNGQDEARFLQWREAHTVTQDEIPHAYIANVPHVPGPNSGDPVYIHTSPFKRLRGHSNYINPAFYKVCSTDHEALLAWLGNQGFTHVLDVQ